LLWAAGASVCLLRLLRSYVRIARIVRLAEPAPAYGERVFTSRAIAIPVAAGIVHSIVILPADFPETLDAGEDRITIQMRLRDHVGLEATGEPLIVPIGGQ